MSTTSLTAGQVMDRSAALLNDPAKTDYTYEAQLPYLNMAFDELIESLAESNAGITNQTSVIITVPIGKYAIIPPIGWEDAFPGFPTLPVSLIEIQEVAERAAGSNDSFIPLVRREFIDAFPRGNTFGIWSYSDQMINFNPNGANNVREIQLKYISDYGTTFTDPNELVYINNARSFLSYKTAALCAQFIGENETRAGILDGKAEQALERLTGINNKGKQQIMTRHRPFRSGYKSRGWL